MRHECEDHSKECNDQSDHYNLSNDECEVCGVTLGFGGCMSCLVVAHHSFQLEDELDEL